MDDTKMIEIAEKIKNKTATEEEILAFTKEFNRVLEELNSSLSK